MMNILLTVRLPLFNRFIPMMNMEKMLAWPLSSLQRSRGHCSWFYCPELYCVCLFLLCQYKTLHLNVQHQGQKDICSEILKNRIFIFRRGQNGAANSVNIGFIMTWPDVLLTFQLCIIFQISSQWCLGDLFLLLLLVSKKALNAHCCHLCLVMFVLCKLWSWYFQQWMRSLMLKV